MSDGDDVQAPADGAGPMNHRTYRVRIHDSLMTPGQLIEAFRMDPNRFCPTSYATFTPDPAPEGLQEAASVEVKLPGPWDGPVRVASVRDHYIRLETLDGHMEAGSIEFSSRQLDDAVEFRIESTARSGDQIFDVVYHRLGLGRVIQTEMWVQVLEAAVSVSGGRQEGRLELTSIIYEGAAT